MQADDLFDLPADPDEAFVQFEAAVRARFLDNADPEHDREREYIEHIFAFVSVYKFEIGYNLELLLEETGNDFWEGYRECRTKIRILAATKALERNKKQKSGGSDIYVLDAALRLKVHKQIDGIRKLLLESELSVERRETMLSKLSSFSEEVDRDRTHLQQFTAMRVWAQREISEIAQFTEIKEKFDKILEVFSKAAEYLKQLPPPSVPKRLPPPEAKSVDTQDLDEEIPF